MVSTCAGVRATQMPRGEGARQAVLCVCWGCVFLSEGCVFCLPVLGPQSLLLPPCQGTEHRGTGTEGQSCELVLRSAGTSASFSDQLRVLYLVSIWITQQAVYEGHKANLGYHYL